MENQVMEQVLTEQTAPTQKPEQIEQNVGFWEFFGLIVLFAIPVIGFIAALIFLFVPQRKSLKNFAGATLAWLIVRAIAAAISIVIAITVIGGMMIPAINGAFGTEFQDFGEAFDVINGITTGNYSAVIKQMRPQLVEMVGEEYAPLLDELATGKYNDLIEDIAQSNYYDALEDLREGDYPQLKNVLTEQEYNDLVNELERAARGEHSEFFGQMQSFMPNMMP